MRVDAGAKVQDRSAYLDFVKGIAIILVELGHCVQWGSGAEFRNSGLFYEDGLFRFIYSFHMPLFMLVSGYVFYWSFGRRAFRETARRQFRCLLVPCLCWTALYEAIVFQIEGGILPRSGLEACQYCFCGGTGSSGRFFGAR